MCSCSTDFSLVASQCNCMACVKPAARSHDTLRNNQSIRSRDYEFRRCQCDALIIRLRSIPIRPDFHQRGQLVQLKCDWWRRHTICWKNNLGLTMDVLQGMRNEVGLLACHTGDQQEMPGLRGRPVLKFRLWMAVMSTVGDALHASLSISIRRLITSMSASQPLVTGLGPLSQHPIKVAGGYADHSVPRTKSEGSANVLWRV